MNKRKKIILLCMTLTVSLATLSFANGNNESEVAGSEKMTEKAILRLATSASATDDRAQAFEQVFAPAVADFATFEGHWGSTLFKQGTENDALARGNLEMVLTSAQELSQVIPEFSIFSAGYVHRDAEHQRKVFDADFMNEFKKKTEEMLNLKLLTVTYFGRRNLNLRGDKVINTPADMKGVKLRMPGSDAWQFLGKALGANPTPLAFTEVYTALQSGAVDGQDNPIPTTINMKFYEVTDQVILTSHLVDLNYIGISTKIWNQMSADQQKVIQDAAYATADEIYNRLSKKEVDQIAFLEDEGLKVYEPDVNAFRSQVQQAYLESDFSQQWPTGLLDKINNIK